MPTITIREIDNTASGEVPFSNYTALVPGRSNANTTTSPTLAEKLYFESEEFLTDHMAGSETAPEGPGFQYALTLLKLGLPVFYKVIAAETELEAVTVESSFWSPFEDKGKYDLRFITSGGYVSTTTANATTMTQGMIKCAAERGDAIALIDVPEASATTTSAILSFINGLSVSDVVRPADSYTGKTKTENSFKYAYCCANYFTVKGETTARTGSLGYLSCFAKHIEKYPDWFAFAGSVRGVLPFEKVVPTAAFGDAEIAALQKRSVTSGNIFKAVNVIAEIRPYGNIVWGNRTLYPIGIANDSGEIQYGLTASSFMNIRQICCDIKKTLYRASRKLTFEPNSDTLWVNFVSEIKPLLEQMKTGQGIRGYQIVKEKSKASATLKARIIIIPIEAVEDFDLTVELSDSISVTE